MPPQSLCTAHECQGKDGLGQARGFVDLGCFIWQSGQPCAEASIEDLDKHANMYLLTIHNAHVEPFRMSVQSTLSQQDCILKQQGATRLLLLAEEEAATHSYPPSVDHLMRVVG